MKEVIAFKYLSVWLDRKMRGNVKVSRCLAGSEDERECAGI